MADRIAKCGNNCGRCPLYRGDLRNQTKEWCAAGMSRYLGWNPQPQNLRGCAGCQASDGFLYLKNCKVRQCAQYNGVENCAHCSAFPCRDVPTVSLAADYRDRAAERLGEPVSEQDYLAFIEPYQGIKHLESIRASLAPPKIVSMKAVRPLRARLADFPTALPLPDEEIAAFRALNRLIADVRSGRAETRARQLELEKRRDNILNILWVFGRYGELDQQRGPCLVIDGAKHGGVKDFSNVVRKRDNTLHDGTAVSVEILADFGVTVEHVPLSKKTWSLKLAFDQEAGGEAALQALQRYVTVLVERYGEPTYAGSSRYKGAATVCFAKADMGVLNS